MSLSSSISADGRFVAFESAASNLVDGDSNNDRDIFIHDRATGTAERVNVSSSGEQTMTRDSYLRGLSISADGRFVAFESKAANLVTGDTNSSYDIFVAENPLVINIQGEPVIDGASESGVYFWRETNGRTLMQVVAGGSAENGQVTDFEGHITSGSAISALQAIGLENSDSLTQSSMNSVDFKLLAQRPWNDRIGFVADSAEPLCVDLSVYVGGLFLGPDKIEVPSPFDIHGMHACGKLDGEPVVDAVSESGVFVWRNPFGRYSVKVAAGGVNQLGNPTVFSGSIMSVDSLRDLTNLTLESSDVLTLTAADKIDFDLLTQRPGSDRFDFSLMDTAAICIELTHYAGGLFLGRNKVEVIPPYDSNGLAMCDNLTIAVEGAPPINKTTDVGWFIWRENGAWHNRFVTGSTTHRFNGSYSSSSTMTNFAPISIESNDHLGALPSKRLDFSLRVINPYQDGFNLVVDVNANTCVTLDAPSGVNIYLGPNRVLMPQSFDLNTLAACQNEPVIATLGKPSIDRTTNKGIFMWERAPNDWSVEVVTGDATASVIDIDVLSQQQLSNVVPIGIESNDVFTVLSQQLELRLRVKAPWYDGFEFSAQAQSGTCVSTLTPAMPIFLGPDRVEVGSNVNLDTLASCQ